MSLSERRISKQTVRQALVIDYRRFVSMAGAGLRWPARTVFRYAEEESLSTCFVLFALLGGLRLLRLLLHALGVRRAPGRDCSIFEIDRFVELGLIDCS